MKLSALTQGVECTLVQGSMDTEITDIVYDSRKAAPGVLFVCIVGTQRDSHAFAADCAARGAAALVIQHDISLEGLEGVTVLKVASSRHAMDDHDRGHRHQGQDHHRPHDPQRAGGRRPPCGHDRHQRRVLSRPPRRYRQHHPRELRAAEDLPHLCGRRVRHGGDGGVQPGADDGPGGGHPLRRGGVHQPVPRPHRARRARHL